MQFILGVFTLTLISHICCIEPPCSCFGSDPTYRNTCKFGRNTIEKCVTGDELCYWGYQHGIRCGQYDNDDETDDCSLQTIAEPSNKVSFNFGNIDIEEEVEEEKQTALEGKEYCHSLYAIPQQCPSNRKQNCEQIFHIVEDTRKVSGQYGSS